MSTEYSKNASVNADEEPSLKGIFIRVIEWYKYLLSKWLIILGLGISGGLLGYIYASYQDPDYTATTTFVLESEGGSGGLGQYLGLASMAGIDLTESGGGIFHGDNIMQLYKSRRMIAQTLLTTVEHAGKKQLLIDYFIDFNEMRKSWAKSHLKDLQFNETSDPRLKRLQDSVLNSIVSTINSSYLTVDKPDKRLSIIKVDVKSKDEFFSKTFNDQIVKTVNDFYVQTKTKKSIENVAILQTKVDSVRSVVNEAIYSVAVTADATPNLNPTRQLQRSVPMQRSQFSAETNRAVLGELVKNLEITKISLLKEAPLIQVVDQPVFPLQKEKLGKAKGLILGGIIAGFITIFILLFKKVLQTIME